MSTDDEAQIMFITRKWAPATGGMETWSHRLSEELQRIEPIDVIALPGEADGMPPRTGRLLRFPSTILRRWFARKRPPRILQIGDLALWPIGLLPILQFAPTRVFVAAHGTDAAYHRRGGLRGNLYGLYLKVGSRLLSGATVVANSRATRDVLAETGWRKVETVMLGTDFRPPPSCPPPGKRVLFAGRLVKRKGFAWFVREVLPHLPDEIGLDIAGTVWDEKENHELQHPRVRNLGNLSQPRLAEAYARALCVILPNIKVESGEYEGFGLVALEAAAAGGVVLAANLDGLRDAVIDGETGFLAESGNSRDWANKILEIAGWKPKSRQDFVHNARRRVEEQFSWQRVVGEMCELYDFSP